MPLCLFILDNLAIEVNLPQTIQPAFMTFFEVIALQKLVMIVWIKVLNRGGSGNWVVVVLSAFFKVFFLLIFLLNLFFIVLIFVLIYLFYIFIIFWFSFVLSTQMTLFWFCTLLEKIIDNIEKLIHVFLQKMVNEKGWNFCFGYFIFCMNIMLEGYRWYRSKWYYLNQGL